MRLKHILLLCFICSIYSNAQNLVPNGGFENYFKLPSLREQWSNCMDWNNITLGSRPTPDYYHTMGGGEVRLPDATRASVNPHTGSAVMGLNTYVEGEDIREYISSRLTQPMEVGEWYEVSFWVTNGYDNHEFIYATDGLGLALSENKLQQPIDEGSININPQFEVDEILWETEWRKFSFTIKADQAFEYITIGNFNSDAQTQIDDINALEGTFGIAYYFIDDVEIKHLPGLEIYGEQDVCLGDSIQFIARNDSVFQWYNIANPNQILSTDSILWVVADRNTTYKVQGTLETESISIFVTSYAEVDLGEDAYLCDGRSITLDAQYPSSQYLWSNGSSASSVQVSETGEYWVEIDNGCGPVSDTVVLSFEPCPCYVEFPNAFRPNSDGLNDIYLPSYDCNFEEFRMQIIDRWGYVVFETESIDHGWDGTIRGKRPSSAGYYRCVGFYKHIGTWRFDTGLLLIR